MKKYPSIFNDVLSPITPGPSSSNTCAPFRISRTALQIFGESPSHALIKMCDCGGYPDTFYGMQSDLAFIAGLLNRELIEYDLTKAYDDAAKAGLDVEYRFVPNLPALPSELCCMTLHADANNRSMELTATSLGGGSFLISDIDGCKTDIRGDQYEILIFVAGDDTESATGTGTGTAAATEIGTATATGMDAQLRSIVSGVNEIALCRGAACCIINVKCWQKPDDSTLAALQKLPGALRVCCAAPEYAIIANENRTPLFETPSEMLSYIGAKKIPLWQAAVDYESALSGWSEAQVLEHGDKLYAIAEGAAARGLSGGFSFEGVTTPYAPQLSRAFSEKRLIPTGIGASGALAALGIMEHSNARGTIVCMPTGGSSGVIPAALFSAIAELRLAREDGVKALLVAGLIGSFMFETNYSGAIGCQAEIGCATAMAASALCSLISDDASVACDAASLGIQSTLGLICDPIAGYVQVPCLIRNMTAVSTAAVCANAAAGGFSATVPLEEMIASILRVGETLRPCNALGTCATPTGRRLNEECEDRRKSTKIKVGPLSQGRPSFTR